MKGTVDLLLKKKTCVPSEEMKELILINCNHIGREKDIKEGGVKLINHKLRT